MRISNVNVQLQYLSDLEYTPGAFILNLTGYLNPHIIRGPAVSVCNRMRPSRIKDKFSLVFSEFSQNSQLGENVKTLEIQVKIYP